MSNKSTSQRRYQTQVTEVINRQRLIAHALGKGYNAFLPVYDGGIDFILCREECEGGPADTRKIQLKGRWYIGKKYLGRDIWIAFPDGDDWYIAPHDEMVTMGEAAGYTQTKSWEEQGAYSCGVLSSALDDSMRRWEF